MSEPTNEDVNYQADLLVTRLWIKAHGGPLALLKFEQDKRPPGFVEFDAEIRKLWCDVQSQDATIAKQAAALEKIQKAVNVQAEDEGLWSVEASATELYLQQGLRLLHDVIEMAIREAKP